MNTEPNEPTGPEPPSQTTIHSEGGKVYTGNFDTRGGDFVGRDKNIYIGSLKVPFWLVWVVAAAALVGVVGSIALYVQGDVTQQEARESATLVVAAVTKVFEPTATPTPTPKPKTMKGRFNIAVAEFGAKVADGNVQQVPDGAKLSNWLAVFLNDQLPKDTLVHDFLIWQDELNLPPGNPPIGLRVDAEDARTLLREDNIYAHIVVFGQLDQPTDSSSLTLDFVYREPKIATEPDGDLGHQRLGGTIALPPAWNETLREDAPLVVRAQAIIGLSRGLALEFWRDKNSDKNNYNLLDEEALQFYQQFDQQLPAEKWQDGREVLYYFTGRVAFRLRKLKTAEEMYNKAKELRPDYVSALVGLGNVQYERAQLWLFANNEITTTTIAACSGKVYTNTENVQLPASLTATITTTTQAIGYYQQAVTATATFGWPPAAPIARYKLANAVRFRGDLHWKLGQLDEAEADLQQAQRLLEAELELLTANQDYGYVAYSLYGLGLAQRTLARIARERGQTDDAVATFQVAANSFSRCQEFKKQASSSGDTQIQERAACYCSKWQEKVQEEEKQILEEDKGTIG